MALCVSSSHNPLISFPAAASRPLFSSQRFATITCSSKRRKKASAKSKPSKPNLSQNEELLPGVGGGASTLTALQPLLDEEDPLLQQKLQLELQLAHQRILHKLPSDPHSRHGIDPLSRFTLASYGSSNLMVTSKVVGDSADEVNNDNDNDEDGDESLSHDAAIKVGNAADVLEDDDSDFEWLEMNAKDDDAKNGEDGEEDRFVYWEGELPPMTAEEEAKALHRTKKELAQLDKENRNSINSVAYRTQDEDALEEEEDDDPEGYMSEKNLSDAEVALAEFEANARKLKSANKVKSVMLDSHMPSGNEVAEKLDEEEDEAAFIARITKEIRGQEKRGSNARAEDGDTKQQKRAIPAVMRSFDKAKVFVKAGNGGNGVVAFRREKFVPFGGPSGGSGGRGGNIYVKADPSMNSLLTFRKSVHFRAGRGNHGMGKGQDGATGSDCIINVPLGTVIREAAGGHNDSGKVLLELTRPDQCELLLPGGRGGRGNSAFKTGRNKTPQLAEYGEEGAEMWVELELKLVADVGIIGVPNAGKSTLLSVISAAQPAIAAYPFTTLLPNLGVVPIGFMSTMVVADLPGLLEGAHLGIGLGHEFLRHTERCRVLVHMVDGMSQQPEQEYEAVRLELQLFNPALSDKPYIVAFNKMDIPEAAERWPCFQAHLRQMGIEPICISAATKMGVNEVVNKSYSLLQSLPSSPYEDEKGNGSQVEDEVAVGEMIRRQRSAPIEEFEIIEDEDSKTWRIKGIGLERFTQMTNWEYFEALTRFQHVLNVSGVNQALRERGVEEGDTVIVGEMMFDWHDSEDIMAMDWKRGFRGSRLWPH